MISFTKRFCSAAILSAAVSLPVTATVVQIQTSQGDFEVNLFDSATPETVANFLAYVEDNTYQNSILHRSIPGFVLQGGGYTYDANENLVIPVVTGDPVINEPVYSNIRGTIAMAKGSDPNSATSQWFINLANNASNLDNQNQGFTVFGVVLDNGMDTVDVIADLPVTDISEGNPLSAFKNLPVQGVSEDDLANDDWRPDGSNYVFVTDIVVTNTEKDLFPETLPPESTKNNQPTNPGSGGSSSGGGAFAWWSLLALGAMRLFRK